MALSSASVGGGLSKPTWIVNVRVPRGYDRVDIAAHVDEVTAQTGLSGIGIGLLTAANLDNFGSFSEQGIRVDVTAGISHPTWAANRQSDTATSAHADDAGRSTPTVGTVNIVATMPVGLEAGAAVNAVATITEAKTQAFFERNIDGTGTATDAVVVVWPSTSERSATFCGPRSHWGAPLARAAHNAVGTAIDRARGVADGGAR